MSEHTMIKFKDGVKLFPDHLDANTIRILKVAAKTAPTLRGATLVVTSAYRSWPPTSLHPKMRAFDIRVGSAQSGREGVVIADDADEHERLCLKWAAKIQEELGGDYDVVYGDENHRDHIHGEYDPK